MESFVGLSGLVSHMEIRHKDSEFMKDCDIKGQRFEVA